MPAAAGREIEGRSSRCVMCLQMFRLWTFLRLVGVGIPDGRAVWGAGHLKDIPGSRVQRSACVKALATKVRADDKPPGSEAAGFSPVVGTDDIPQVGRLEIIQLSSPPDSGQLSPDSPLAVAFEDMLDSSVLLSPNRVQAGGRRMFRMKVVCLTCRQLRQDF